MNEIKMYLLRNKLTIKAFAERIDYHYTYVTDVCSGRRKIGKRLAKAIERESNGELKADDLMAGKW